MRLITAELNVSAASKVKQTREQSYVGRPQATFDICCHWELHALYVVPSESGCTRFNLNVCVWSHLTREVVPSAVCFTSHQHKSALGSVEIACQPKSRDRLTRKGSMRGLRQNNALNLAIHIVVH